MLKVSNLNASYGVIPVLHQVSLDIAGKEIVALVGSNGAGKTTLLNTISGLLRCTTGEISFMDQRIENLPPHEIVACGIVQIPEGRKIFPYLTVKENLLLMIDEPSLGLGPLVMVQIYEVLKTFPQEGITVFLSEQNAQQALEMADRGYVLQDGHVVLEGSSEKLLNSELVKKAYLGI
jgi:branched-chain amino acid transport system ATP-binding protein